MHHARTCLVLLLTLLAACDRVPTSTQPPALDVGHTSEANAPTHCGRSLGRACDNPFRPQEQAFERISARVPGFGGFFYENDKIVVYVTDLDQATAVRSAVEPEIAAHRSNMHQRSLASSEILVRQGGYSFAELRDLRNAVARLKNSDLSFLDVDEQRNRVVIGLATGSGREELTQRLTDLHIPPSSYEFEVRGPFRPAAGLRSDRSTFDGGLRIRRYDGVGAWDCSLGFNAVRNSDTVFVTASHCNDSAETLWTHNPVDWWQAQSVGTSIADDEYDPPGVSCYDDHTCGYSDAALQFHLTSSFQMAKIARTVERSYSGAGSIVIDSTKPQIAISGWMAWGIENMAVDKIGQVSGWTAGRVARTCVDHYGPNSTILLCQDEALLTSSNGDSGAPLFHYKDEDSTAVLMGVLRGVLNDTLVYSPIANVVEDFGNLTDGSSWAYPELSATIDGPEEVYPGAWACGWEASVSGGNGVNTYQWSGVKSGTGIGVSHAPYTSGYLVLEVWSGDGQYTITDLYISVSEEYSTCSP